MARKHKHIRLNEAELTEVVTEALIRLLSERSGISDEVVEATNQVLEELYKTDFKNLDWQKTVIYDESLMWPYSTVVAHLKLQNTISSLNFKGIKEINIELVNFFTLDDVEEYSVAAGIGGQFNFDGCIITVTLPCVDLIPLKGNANEIIGHELNHVYQNALKGYEAESNTYAEALKILNQPNKYDKEEWIIANLIYRLDKREIDANAMELYAQLCGKHSGPSRLKDVSVLNNYRFIKEANYIKEKMAKVYLNNAETYNPFLKHFSISPSEFATFVKKGASYLDRKIRQVINRYITQANEGRKITKEYLEMKKMFRQPQ